MHLTFVLSSTWPNYWLIYIWLQNAQMLCYALSHYMWSKMTAIPLLSHIHETFINMSKCNWYIGLIRKNIVWGSTKRQTSTNYQMTTWPIDTSWKYRGISKWRSMKAYQRKVLVTYSLKTRFAFILHKLTFVKAELVLK